MKKTEAIFPVPDCRRFTGYKPCEPYKACPCDSPEPMGRRILIINLDFIGDVLMTTSLLPAISRKYPGSAVHWITLRNALPVLENNPFLYKIHEWNDENRMILQSMKFEEVLNADKNRNSSAFTGTLKAGTKLGFGLNENGAIVPLNPEALYNYRMGLDDDLKFRKNRRTGQEILAETWRLDYRRDEYVLELTGEEKKFCERARADLGFGSSRFVVGLNTGCSGLYPLKKMTVRQHVLLIRRISEAFPDTAVLLLGGREDTDRNREIQALTGSAILTPTTEGLRQGILYENLCDLVITGDTLGMHIAIGLKKTVIAWFGLSCASEIDLYGRDEKIISDAPCSPCWKRQCDKPVCLERLDLDHMVQLVGKYRNSQLRGQA
jgi:heptosyltransferase-2